MNKLTLGDNNIKTTWPWWWKHTSVTARDCIIYCYAENISGSVSVFWHEIYYYRQTDHFSAQCTKGQGRKEIWSMGSVGSIKYCTDKMIITPDHYWNCLPAVGLSFISLFTRNKSRSPSYIDQDLWPLLGKVGQQVIYQWWLLFHSKLTQVVCCLSKNVIWTDGMQGTFQQVYISISERFFLNGDWNMFYVWV